MGIIRLKRRHRYSALIQRPNIHGIKQKGYGSFDRKTGIGIPRIKCGAGSRYVPDNRPAILGMTASLERL